MPGGLLALFSSLFHAPDFLALTQVSLRVFAACTVFSFAVLSAEVHATPVSLPSPHKSCTPASCLRAPPSPRYSRPPQVEEAPMIVVIRPALLQRLGRLLPHSTGDVPVHLGCRTPDGWCRWRPCSSSRVCRQLPLPGTGDCRVIIGRSDGMGTAWAQRSGRQLWLALGQGLDHSPPHPACRRPNSNNSHHGQPLQQREGGPGERTTERGSSPACSATDHTCNGCTALLGGAGAGSTLDFLQRQLLNAASCWLWALLVLSISSSGQSSRPGTVPCGLSATAAGPALRAPARACEPPPTHPFLSVLPPWRRRWTRPWTRRRRTRTRSWRA